MDAHLDAYLESWTNELDARSNRVRQLIGDAHWLSDGHHKEIIIKEFLARYLPNHLSISRGFVRPAKSQGHCSPEIDILISDPHKSIPYFSEGGLQIVPPNSVVAVIEVKSSFSRKNLDNALLNISSVKNCVRQSNSFNKLWTCICFFSLEQTRTSQSFLDTLTDSLNYLRQEQFSGQSAEHFIQFLPSCISTLSRYLIFLKPLDGAQLQVRIFDLGKYALPCAIIDLFSSVTIHTGGTISNDYDDVIDSVVTIAPLVSILKFEEV
ncbi:DUF6602 domain-containing protein [Undibacterium sp.]|uniref:DUF6602 domain-containing protein n=1 Tax=Undibacterium sp. TaxID=1914977 RepID=UPI002730A048|nr:DUF6602 domain-containing protein [Undibacterium sp.]MDP1980240.1 hypothetical protein [Undibacterium sp.]